MNITAEQMDLKKGKKKIGTIKGVPVYAMSTKGGLNMVIFNGKLLAAAPHRGLAKYMAFQKEPDLSFDELSKSEEELPFELYKHLADKWIEVTDKINLKIEDIDGI